MAHFAPKKAFFPFLLAMAILVVEFTSEGYKMKHSVPKINILLAQCLESYFGDPGKFSMVFSVVFQASTGKKLWGKNHGTRKFDAKHSAIDCIL